jgi:hypothetical protein
MTEVYISFDIETLGGNTHTNPMFNLGAVAYTPDRRLLGEITLNLAWPEGAVADKDTLDWFIKNHAEAYARMTLNPIEPGAAMALFRDWVYAMAKAGGTDKGPARCVFMAYPVIYDGSWLYHYWFRYLGHPNNGRGPGFSMIDIRTFAMAKLNLATYEESRKDKALAPYAPDAESYPHTHTGLDDAHEQAMLYFNVRDGIKK